jgi:hypothetical protein
VWGAIFLGFAILMNTLFSHFQVADKNFLIRIPKTFNRSTDGDKMCEVLRSFFDVVLASEMFLRFPSDSYQIYLRSEVFTMVALCDNLDVDLYDAMMFVMQHNPEVISFVLDRDDVHTRSQKVLVEDWIVTMRRILFLLVDVDKAVESPKVVRHWNFKNIGLRGVPVSIEQYRTMIRRSLLEPFDGSRPHPFGYLRSGGSTKYFGASDDKCAG